MLILISPAKNYNYDKQKQTTNFTIPDFLKQSEILLKKLRNYKPSDLSELLHINPKLAELSFERHLKWHIPFTQQNAKQALLTYRGEVYRGIKAENYTENELLYAQEHLRILSGLYGLLRPLDLIQPYRLEMGTPFPNPKGNNLYKFWTDLVTNEINFLLKKDKHNALLLLGSAEYCKVLNFNKIKTRVISPIFYESQPGGDYKVIVVYTKKARGLMTSFILKNKITDPEEIKYFDWEGYTFNPRYGNDDEWVFTR